MWMTLITSFDDNTKKLNIYVCSHFYNLKFKYYLVVK